MVTTAGADDPPKLEPVPDPGPIIEPSFDEAVALSVLEAADEEDDPNSDPDPTL